jgi:hypothetical protein
MDGWTDGWMDKDGWEGKKIGIRYAARRVDYAFAFTYRIGRISYALCCVSIEASRALHLRRFKAKKAKAQKNQSIHSSIHPNPDSNSPSSHPHLYLHLFLSPLPATSITLSSPHFIPPPNVLHARLP